MRSCITANKGSKSKVIEWFDLPPDEALMEFIMRRKGNDIPLSYPDPSTMGFKSVCGFDRDAEFTVRGITYRAIKE